MGSQGKSAELSALVGMDVDHPAGSHGCFNPNWIDRLVIGATSRLPENWLGLRLAILLRRLVTMRLPARALDVARWGLRLRLHPLDNGCEKNLLFTPQMYEPVELRELGEEIARARSQKFVFVDIGANVGLFSLYVAAQAGAKARILAIEPEPGNLARLRFNLDANPGLPIAVLQMALGDAETEAVVEINPRDRGGSYTRAATAADAAASRVRCRPLLSVLREHGISQIDALKIDIEGNEAKVLAPFFRDAPRALYPGLIIIEDTRALWHLDLFAILAKFGYEVAARTRLNAVLRITTAASEPPSTKPIRISRAA